MWNSVCLLFFVCLTFLIVHFSLCISATFNSLGIHVYFWRCQCAHINLYRLNVLYVHLLYNRVLQTKNLLQSWVLCTTARRSERRRSRGGEKKNEISVRLETIAIKKKLNISRGDQSFECKIRMCLLVNVNDVCKILKT